MEENNYNYIQNIKTPKKLGASDAGNLRALGNDIGAIVSYLGLLVDGTSDAAKGGKPLGNKFFYNTGGKCMDSQGELQERHIYINNVPDGNIPLLDGDMGGNIQFKSFRGLIPGMLSQLNNIDPTDLAESLTIGVNPECRKVPMEIRGNTHISTIDEKFMADADIKNLNPCVFPKIGGKKINIITGEKCIESFTGSNISPKLPRNLLFDIYIILAYSLFLYILVYVLKKKKILP